MGEDKCKLSELKFVNHDSNEVISVVGVNSIEYTVAGCDLSNEPDYTSIVGVNGVKLTIKTGDISPKSLNVLFGCDIYKDKPNNWRRMHGLVMRRR